MAVSILMSTYNRVSIVNTAIQSIIDQTYKNWYLTVIDDYSTDDTWKSLQKYKENKRIKLVLNRKNLGSTYSKSPYSLSSTSKY